MLEMGSQRLLINPFLQIHKLLQTFYYVLRKKKQKKAVTASRTFNCKLANRNA